MPVDPWTDDGLQSALLGLKPGQMRSVRLTVQLFAPHREGAAPIDVRSTHLAFDAAGQVEMLTLTQERQHESPQNDVYRYHRDAAGRVARIERSGSPEPFLERRYDSAGRLTEEVEKVGVLLRRTRWRHDAAGRVLERHMAEGSSTPTTETREYRRDGTLAQVRIVGKLSGRTVKFDSSERPVHIEEHDLLWRSTTQIRYLEALLAEHVTSGFAATRDGLRSPSRTVLLRVRDAAEFKQPGEPLLPVARQVAEGGAKVETQTDYDAQGRPRVQRFYGTPGQLDCTSEWHWHASGLPASIHTLPARPGAHCGLDNGTVDMDITVDEHGNWVRQAIEFTYPNVGRTRLSVQTREIGYR